MVFTENAPSGNNDKKESSNLPPILDHKSISPEYITGLCEGEASFTYIRNGRHVNLRFGIKLPETDKNLIFLLQGYFHAGNLYRIEDGGGSWYFCVTKLDEIGNIVQHFDKFPLLGRKSVAFQIWRQMYQLKVADSTGNREVLNGLAERLSGLSRKGRRRQANG